MRKVKLLVKILLFVLIFYGAESLIYYAAHNDTDSISRVMMYEMYHQDKNIDVLFSGASHVQLSFDTTVTDQNFQMNTFNAGSSAQSLQATDAIIREVADQYDLKQVYVDLDYSVVMRDEVNLESIYAVSDYMRPSLNKVAFLLHATPAKYYINSFLPLGKGKTLVHNPKEILSILEKKNSYNYRNHISDVDSYMGKGYIASHVYLEGTGFAQTGEFDTIPSEIPAGQQDTLNDIIEFCKEKNIQLTFITTPMSDFTLTGMGNYDAYVEQIRTFLQGKGVSYYDFNLCKPEVLDLEGIQYYTDDNHLNRDGAAMFSEVFAKFFTGQIEEKDFFYSSYTEKTDAQDSRVYGFCVEDDGSSLSVQPVGNHDIPELTYTYAFDGGPETDNSDYQFGTSGTVVIRAYSNGEELCSASYFYGGTGEAEKLDVTAGEENK